MYARIFMGFLAILLLSSTLVPNAGFAQEKRDGAGERARETLRKAQATMVVLESSLGTKSDLRRAAGYFARAAEILGPNDPESASHFRTAANLIHTQNPERAARWLVRAAEISMAHGDIVAAIASYNLAAYALVNLRRPSSEDITAALEWVANAERLANSPLLATGGMVASEVRP